MSDELKAFREEVRAWMADNVPPPPDFQLPESFMEVGEPRQFEYLRDWQRKVYDAGYLGMAWEKEYGGRGMDNAYQAIVNQEMRAANAPFMVNIIGLMWAGPVIRQLGTEEQKRRYLPKLLSCEEMWCQGFSEPDNGSDLANVQTTAELDGDDFIVNGTKIWTSLGTEADFMILLARTDKNVDSKYKGLTFFLAPVNIDGVSKHPIKKMTGEYGFNETRFEDARIPRSCVLGHEGEGWSVAMATLMFERGASGGQAGGMSAVALSTGDVIEMAQRSRRNGRPPLEDPVLRDQLVRLVIEERANRKNYERLRHRALVAEHPHLIMMASKLMSTEFRRRLARFAVTLQGGAAALYVDDPDAIENAEWLRHYMNAFSGTIGGGTSQIQHNIIGERVLGLAKG